MIFKVLVIYIYIYYGIYGTLKVSEDLLCFKTMVIQACKLKRNE